MSSRWIRSSSSISPSWSTMMVRRGVENSFLIAVSSSLTMVWMRARERRDVEIIGDLGGELVELRLDLVAAERGQPLQAQIENGLGLLGRQARGPSRRHAVARIVDQRDHGGDVVRRPVALHQLLACFVGVLGGADQPDHFVDIGDRDGQPHQDMRAIARLVEKVLGAPVDHLLAEGDEGRRAGPSDSSPAAGRPRAPPCWRRTRIAAR